jgi:hypothetical protein
MGEKYLLSYEQLPQSSNGLNSIETSEFQFAEVYF